MVKTVEGDLFEHLEPRSVLLHQVNCKGVAGAGIAQEVRSRFPGWFDDYAGYCASTPFEELPGSFISYDVPGADLKICSVFGQVDIGKERRQTDYALWQKALGRITEQLDLRHAVGDVWTVRMPWGIGCGLGGGSWRTMEDLFRYFAGPSPVEYVFYKLPVTR